MARGLAVEQRSGRGGSFCSSVSSFQEDDRRVDEGDQMWNE